MRRFLGFVLVVAVLAAIGVGGFVAIDRLSEEEPAEVDAVEDVGRTAAAVVRTDLIERETLDGTLRFSDPGVILAQAPGTLTAIADPGTVAERGDVLFEVDGVPVVLLYGDRPPWRRLSTSSSDGLDVMQLEENLVALGFDEDGELTVDQEYTSLTADLVEAWQETLGIEETGTVEVGRVVYAKGPIRVGEARVELGALIASGTPVVDTSSSEREVLVLLDADRQDLVAEGDAVVVELPSGDEVDARVRRVGTEVLAVVDGPGVIEVLIDLVDPTGVGGLDRAPVEVQVVSEQALGVLAVPVEALIALAEGGYAVEVQDGSATRLVGIEIGDFGENLVEVVGDIAEGDLVVVPK